MSHEPEAQLTPTDAYLAQLARAHRSRLATFDQAMAKLQHDVADLVPDRFTPV